MFEQELQGPSVPFCNFEEKYVSFYNFSPNYMLRRMLSSSAGPIEREIQRKLTTTFNPSVLEIRNDSHKHAHHAGLRGASNVTESHFYVTMVSEKFEGMNQPSRHRAVYKELDEEFKEKGLHALQLKTKTPKEYTS